MKKQYFLYFSLLFFAACATPRNPTGGPKDLIPPKVISSTPDSAQINFSGNRVVLKFDEYFTATNTQTQIIFSPPLKYPPKYQTKKQSFIIDIKDTLKKNTTYTINFGKSFCGISVHPGT